MAVPVALMDDARFAAPSAPVDTSRLFNLSPAMTAYLQSSHFRQQVRDKGEERGLIDALYKEGELKLDYDATVTRPAAETFAARSGNCLSLVIMTAAFSKELGFKVIFQDVRVEETWSRQEGLYMASTHVNVLLGRHRSTRPDGFQVDTQLLVDFLSPEDAAGHKSKPIGERTIVAMYANNRAVEALGRGQFDDAYWWARKALEEDPAYNAAYNTLGVVYQRHGDAAHAETVFRAALALEPDNRKVMQNLVPVLEQLGKTDEAARTRTRLAALDPNPPFHFFQIGTAAMARKEYHYAREMFAREVQRAPYNHEFHYWHALASLRLGDTDVARKDLALAVSNSTTAGSRAQYSAKLEHLRAQLPPRRR